MRPALHSLFLRGLPLAPPCVCALLLTGCFLTDHGEGEINTRDLHFPASGYERLDAKDLPAITFDATEVDMGRIAEGAQVQQRFTFKNTGGSPLVLSAVNSTCGCTVGKDWPRDPIPPGGTGHVDVTFDSNGRTGRQHKTVTVVSNAHPPSTVLTLTGEVVGPASQPEQQPNP
jgi:hypothetical protein